MTERGFCLCTTPRSGSNWICELLSSTGSLGVPREYFNAEGQRRTRNPDYPTSRLSQRASVLTEGATPNGVYAFKVFPGQVNAVASEVTLLESFPSLCFVYLKRQDLLAQAISLTRANQTQKWTSWQTTSANENFDSETILTNMRLIASQCARWEVFFARNAMVPTRIIYEDVLLSPQVACDLVAKALRIDKAPEIDFSKVQLRSQQDRIASEWRDAFLNDAGRTNVLDLLTEY